MSNDPSPEQIKYAESLGIDVDKRWSKDTLQRKIDEKKAEQAKDAPEVIQEPPAQPQPGVDMRPTNLGATPPAVQGRGHDPQPPQPKKGETPIRLKADVWFEADKRTTAGTVVKVDVETAKRMIREDKAERADPLPGED